MNTLYLNNVTYSPSKATLPKPNSNHLYCLLSNSGAICIFVRCDRDHFYKQRLIPSLPHIFSLSVYVTHAALTRVCKDFWLLWSRLLVIGHSVLTSARIGACKCNFPAFQEIKTNIPPPTDQPTNRRTWGIIGKFFAHIKMRSISITDLFPHFQSPSVPHYSSLGP